MHYPVFFVYFSVIRERHARGGKIGNLTTEDTESGGQGRGRSPRCPKFQAPGAASAVPQGGHMGIELSKKLKE